MAGGRNDWGDVVRKERGQEGRYIASSPLETLQAIFGGTIPSWDELPKSLPKDPLVLGALGALGGVGLTFGSLHFYRRCWRRIKNPNDVTGRMLDQKRWVKGVVTSVGDGGEYGRRSQKWGVFENGGLMCRQL